MIFYIGKIRVNISFLFFACAAFYLSGEMAENYICALFFASLHELGHLVPMLIFKCRPASISVGVFGVKIEKLNSLLSYFRECIVALCGPFVNLIFAVLFFVLMKENSELYIPFAVNTGLFVINLMPVKALDGGRFLYAFLSMGLDEDKCGKILKICETVTIFVLCIVMLLSVAAGYANTSFVFFCLALVSIITAEIIGTLHRN